MRKIQSSLRECGATLTGWSKQKPRDSEGELRRKTDRLKEQQEEGEGLKSEEVQELQGELGLLLEQEDLKWRQRAKMKWFLHGDRNTKYLHACANQRRRKNINSQVVDSQGKVMKEQGDIEMTFRLHFEEVLSSGTPSREVIETCLKSMDSRVTREMNENLIKDFNRGEIENAVQQMRPFKSPGHDGFGAYFFQKY